MAERKCWKTNQLPAAAIPTAAMASRISAKTVSTCMGFDFGFAGEAATGEGAAAGAPVWDEKTAEDGTATAAACAGPSVASVSKAGGGGACAIAVAPERIGRASCRERV